MLKQSLLLFLILTCCSVYTQDWSQDKTKTSVTFKIKNFGVNVDGDFSDVEIKTNFDSNNIENSYINAVISVKSISTGINSRDEHILEEDYFDEPNHKKITLESTKIEFDKYGDYILHANLTIKGITKKTKIPFVAVLLNDKLVINASFKINRKDYQVGGGSLIMGKNVSIGVQFTGTKPN